MPALARLCLAAATVTACSGSPEPAPASAPASAPAPGREGPSSPAAPASLRESPAWKVGNWWLYRVEESPGDGQDDASVLPTFRLLREVVKVEPRGERALLVTVRQQGGSYVDHSMVLVVSDTCVEIQSSGHKIYCTSPDAGPPEPVPGPLQLRGHRYVSDPFVAAFDPEVGIVSSGNLGNANRTSSTTLVGFKVGDRVEGEPREEPVGCLLDRTKDGVGTWTSPAGHSIEVQKRATATGTAVTVARTAGGKRAERVLEVAGAPPAKVSLRLIPDEGRCVLRIHSSHESPPAVTDVDVSSVELPSIRGTLTADRGGQGQ